MDTERHASAPAIAPDVATAVVPVAAPVAVPDVAPVSVGAVSVGAVAAGRGARAATAGVLVYAVASVGTNASQAIFHVVAAGSLGPADYGALGSLVSIMAALALPVTAVQAVVTGTVARGAGAGFDPRPAMRRSVLAGVAAAAILLALGPALRGYEHLTSLWPVVYVAADCVPVAGGMVAWGVLCGQRRFGTLGPVGLAGALARIGLAVLFLRLGFGVAGALAASLAADSLRTGLLWWAASRGTRAWHGRAPALRLRLRRALAGASAMAAVQGMLTVDALLARHYLAAAQAGLYIAATTAAQLVFFGVQVICTLVLPRFAVGDGDRSRRTLRATLALSAGLGVAATGALVVLGPVVLPALIGHGFAVPGDLLALRGLAAVTVGLLSIVVSYGLTRSRSARPAVVWLGVLAVAVAGLACHADAVRLAAATCTAVVVVWLPLARERLRAGTPPPATGDT